MFAIVDRLQKSCSAPVGDLGKTMVDLRGPGWIKCIREQVKRARLVGSLKNIRDVGEKDIIKEVAELEPG